jgi:hypothetical protein
MRGGVKCPMASHTARSAAASSSKSSRAGTKKAPQPFSPAEKKLRVVAASSPTWDTSNGRPPADQTADPLPLHPDQNPPPANPHPTQSPNQNGDSSEASTIGEVPPAVEAAFVKVPGEVLEPGAEADEDFSADDLRELMDEVQFEAEDCAETLAELFDALAEFFGSDHWKLSPRQQRMWGKPLAKLLNSVWAEVCRRLPDLVARWAETLPGLAGTTVDGVMISGPKLVKQVRIWRKRRAGGPAKPAERQTEQRPAAAVMPSHSEEVIAPGRGRAA